MPDPTDTETLAERQRIAQALKGHSRDTMSQDSGQHCKCGSDSRFTQRDRATGAEDPPWSSIDEHRADVVLAARIVQARAGEGALRERIEALADEWEREGGDLIRNCYSGRDVNEGEQIKSCARDLRAALDTAGDPT